MSFSNIISYQLKISLDMFFVEYFIMSSGIISYQYKTSLDMFVELLKFLGALVEFRVLGALV